MKKSLPTLFFCLMILLGGCGSSGTWDDDAQNWNRAFKVSKPKDVNVIHSRYWRSAHWSYEFEYFFKIGKNDKLKTQLFSENKLKQIEGKEAEEAMIDFFREKPEWFIPERADKYEIYIYNDKPGGYFRVFINRNTNDIYLTDYQI